MITMTALDLRELQQHDNTTVYNRSAREQGEPVRTVEFVGDVDDFSGAPLKCDDDGAVFLRIFDPEEPHGECKVVVTRPWSRIPSLLGLKCGEGKKVRVRIEVLP